MDFICLACEADLHPNERLSVTPCGHMFHTDCLTPVALPPNHRILCAACAQVFAVSGLVRLYGTTSTNNNESICEGSNELQRLHVRHNELLHNRKDYLEKQLRELNANLTKEAAEDTDTTRVKGLELQCAKAAAVYEQNLQKTIPQLQAQLERLPLEEELWPTLVEQRLRVQQIEASLAHYAAEAEPFRGRNLRVVKSEVLHQKKTQVQTSAQECETARDVERSRAELFELLCRCRELQTREFELTSDIVQARHQRDMVSHDRTLMVLRQAIENKSTIAPTTSNSWLSQKDGCKNRAGTRPRPKQLSAVQNSMSRRMSC